MASAKHSPISGVIMLQVVCLKKPPIPRGCISLLRFIFNHFCQQALFSAADLSEL